MGKSLTYIKRKEKKFGTPYTSSGHTPGDIKNDHFGLF